jgi:hypothetical protein
MLYKSSDADNKPNLTVLSQLIEQHGVSSDQVLAFLDLYADDKEFIKRATALINRQNGDEE